MTIEHSLLANDPTESQHGIIHQTVADTAALAAITITAEDVAQARVFKQTDSGQLWVPLTTGAAATFTLLVVAVSNTSPGIAPLHAGAGDVGKSLVATATGSKWQVSPAFYANWGCVAAAAPPSKYLVRTAGTASTSLSQGEYPVPQSGTFVFTVTWRVSGTPLVTDTVALTVMKNGVATALALTIPASTTSGQASASLTVTAGDGMCIRILQSASEAQAAWNLNVSLIGT